MVAKVVVRALALRVVARVVARVAVVTSFALGRGDVETIHIWQQ